MDHVCTDQLAVVQGFQVCMTCGETVDGYIDMKHSWAAETSTSSSSSLTTLIGKSSGAHNHRLQRVQQWNSVTPREREMRQTLQEFESIQGAMGLSSQIIDQAVELYERILARLTDNVIYRCKRRSSLRAASIFFACKELGVPRERKEISKALLVPLKNVTKCCNLYLDLLGKDFREKPPLTAVDFVERYCALLGICDRQLVVDLIHSASRLNLLSDKTPTSVASACILFSIDHLNLPISKQDVQDKCGNSSAILTRSHAILVKNKERILADIKAHSSL